VLAWFETVFPFLSTILELAPQMLVHQRERVLTQKWVLPNERPEGVRLFFTKRLGKLSFHGGE
jgi:hypothetical protein